MTDPIMPFYTGAIDVRVFLVIAAVELGDDNVTEPGERTRGGLLWR